MEDAVMEGLDGEPMLSLAMVEHVAQQQTLLDWDTLLIQDNGDNVASNLHRGEVVDDEVMYRLMGFRDEEEAAEMAREAASNVCSEQNGGSEAVDTTGAAIVVDDSLPGEVFLVHDPNRPRMTLGIVYPNQKEFRLALKQYAINEEFELKLRKTDTTRTVYDCNAESCPWHIFGKTQPNKTVMVTKLIGNHTCTSSARRKTTTPCSAWVASKAIHHLRKKITMGPKDLREVIQDEHKCVIHYDTVCRGRKIALQELFGNWEESFQMLFNWKAAVMERSPGSVVEIGLAQNGGKFYFYRFFCALKPCIDGFLEGCRPYIAVDSTALNGRWNGHLAAACAIDGHNWMYPIAFGFIDGETTENWTWFLIQLHKAIGDLPVLAISSDACKGLENAVKAVFPHAEHRECFRHLMKNFVKRFGSDVNKMYPAARAYRESVFLYFFKQVVEENPDVLVWLQEYHYKKWYRSGFNPDIKCDYITSNLAEVFNNWIRDWKDLPIVELADKLQEMMMVLWAKRRKISERLNGLILPAVIQQLKAKTRGLGHLSVVDSGNNTAQVQDTTHVHSRHVVNLELHQCTCLEWQHTGKPCQHAFAYITSVQASNVHMEKYVHEYYSVERFRTTYRRIIEPLPDRSQWPNVELPVQVHAPLGKKTAGRNRKLRIKGCLEGGNSKGKKAAKEAANEVDRQAEIEAQAQVVQKTMIRGKRKCKRCGEFGHGETSYKCHLNGTKKRQRKPRKNTTKYGPNAKIPTKRAKKGAAAGLNAKNEQTMPPTNGPSAENEQDMALAAAPIAENDLHMALAAAPSAENDQNMPLPAAPIELSSPTRLTRERIIENSPNRVTRRQLQSLLGQASNSGASPVKTINKRSPAKKLKPRKMKLN